MLEMMLTEEFFLRYCNIHADTVRKLRSVSYAYVADVFLVPSCLDSCNSFINAPIELPIAYPIFGEVSRLG